MAVDFENPSEEALAQYRRIIQHIRQRQLPFTLRADKEGGAELYFEQNQLKFRDVEHGFRETTETLHPEADRTKLLMLLYGRLKRYTDPADLPLEVALRKYLWHYCPGDPLLEGKPDPGIL